MKETKELLQSIINEFCFRKLFCKNLFIKFIEFAVSKLNSNLNDFSVCLYYIFILLIYGSW
jgi:hypothetical protein